MSDFPLLKNEHFYQYLIRGEPERAPNTRGTGSGFICMILYIYMCIKLYVCLWGDHFSEERVKF